LEDREAIQTATVNETQEILGISFGSFEKQRVAIKLEDGQ
jgi:hypothetical protein